MLAHRDVMTQDLYASESSSRGLMVLSGNHQAGCSPNTTSSSYFYHNLISDPSLLISRLLHVLCSDPKGSKHWVLGEKVLLALLCKA